MSCSFKTWRVRVGKTSLLRATPVLLIIIFFGFLNSSFSELPLSTAAPYVGQKAPGFILPGQHGKPVSLADSLKPTPGARKSGEVGLIFYRGYW
jgi:hypothetical protein